jgi:hypothetical protein
MTSFFFEKLEQQPQKKVGLPKKKNGRRPQKKEEKKTIQQKWKN